MFKKSCIETHPLYLHSFWKFYTSRTAVGLAFQLKSQQHGWAKSPGWLSSQLELPAWGPTAWQASAKNQPGHYALEWDTRTTTPISLERAPVFDMGWELGNWNTVFQLPLSESKPKPQEFVAKLLHFDRCLFLGKFLLVPCGQGHFYSTSTCVLRKEAACISVRQCVIQHCHLSVCHHTPVSVC